MLVSTMTHLNTVRGAGGRYDLKLSSLSSHITKVFFSIFAVMVLYHSITKIKRIFHFKSSFTSFHSIGNVAELILRKTEEAFPIM